MDALEYTLTRTELIAVKAWVMMKQEKAIRRNKENPTQDLADLLDELQNIVRKLDRSLVMFDEQQQEMRIAKKQLFEYKTEVKKLVKQRDELLVQNDNLVRGI